MTFFLCLLSSSGGFKRTYLSCVHSILTPVVFIGRKKVGLERKERRCVVRRFSTHKQSSECISIGVKAPAIRVLGSPVKPSELATDIRESCPVKENAAGIRPRTRKTQALVFLVAAGSHCQIKAEPKGPKYRSQMK